MKDTGLNISTNNISSNIKVDPDEFALKTNKKYTSDQIKECDQDITLCDDGQMCRFRAYKSGRVVVFDRFGIAEGLKDGVRLQ